MTRKDNGVMALSRKDKKSFILLILVVTSVIAYLYVYKPIDANLSELRKEVRTLEARYQELVFKNARRKNIETDIKSVQYQISKLDALLPPRLAQERMILTIKELRDATSVELDNLVFSKVTPIDTGVSAKESTTNKKSTIMDPFLERNKQLEQIQNQQQAQEVYPDFEENMGMRTEIKTSYRATYDQIKHFLYETRQYPNKVFVKDIVFRGFDGENVLGNVTLVFYGLYNQIREMSPWEITVDKGADSIFTIDDDDEVVVEKETNQKMIKPSDFVMTVKPFSSDLPSLIVGKAGDRLNETYVYADSNIVEEVEMALIEQEGTYYFKYRTKQQSYPKKYDEQMAAFIPNQQEFVLDIFSNKRLGDEDVNGVTLFVENHTNKAFHIHIHNEDEKRPRVDITVHTGNVEIFR